MPCDKWQGTIPSVKGECMAIILWLFNIYYPGFGTIYVSCLGNENFIMDQFLVGLLQYLTAGCIFGWVWSIWWGSLIFKKHG